MKFRNKSTDTLLTPFGTVEPGGEIDATPEQAAGLVGQCGPDGRWEPADDDTADPDKPAKKTVKKTA